MSRRMVQWSQYPLHRGPCRPQSRCTPSWIEGLAGVSGVSKFRQYLLGRHFTIHCDHKPLMHLFAQGRAIPQMASARVQRWALLLSAYDYTFFHRPGKENSDADALSRLPLPTTPEEVLLPGETVLLLDALQTLLPQTSRYGLAGTLSQDPQLRSSRLAHGHQRGVASILSAARTS